MQKPGLFGMNGFMVFLLSCFSFAADAQTGYIVLIDAENKQPFTVRVGDELYASSGHGHIALSNLRDSNYKLSLQFPKKNIPEQIFPVKINQKDLGFLLKAGDSSWTLYNWQTKETIRPVAEKDSSRILDRGVKREDGFSMLMAAVVNDTSVMYNTYTEQGFNHDSSTAVSKTHIADQNVQMTTALNVKDTKPKPAPASKDSTTMPTPLVAQGDNQSATAVKGKKNKKGHQAAGTADQTAALVVPQAVAGQPPVTKDSVSGIQSTASTGKPVAATGFSTGYHSLSTVKKVREVSLKISRKMVFLDMGRDGQKDTITLFIYFENEEVVKSAVTPAPALKKLVKTDSAVLIVKDKPSLKQAEQTCTQLATDEDLEAVRSAILKANAEQDKISVASGAFAIKCFSVNQVRVLAGLFVSDKAKYRLMDAAHLHLADHDHFSELADMYTDKNFQRKFLAMATRRS
jgi:hypothetical protein